MGSLTMGERVSIYRVEMFRIVNKGITIRPNVIGSNQPTSMCQTRLCWGQVVLPEIPDTLSFRLFVGMQSLSLASLKRPYPLAECKLQRIDIVREMVSLWADFARWAQNDSIGPIGPNTR